MRVSAPLSLLALSGCAMPSGDFPNLAVRPIESRGDAVAPAPPSLPADPAVTARAVALDREITAAAAAFDRARGPAEATAARAGAAGSEGWIAAQLAVNALGLERARVTDALGELDRQAIADHAADRVIAPATIATIERARALLDRQTAAIDAIAARLRD